jgi:glycosyltransferase involved in cell wall biosynthesis
MHLLPGLKVGGAETMMAKLAAGTRHRVTVVSLAGVDEVGELLRSRGTPVRALDMRPGRVSPPAFGRLLALMRELRPDVVQTWMYHADLLGGMAARMNGIPVAWNLRRSTPYTGGVKLSTRLVVRACSVGSRWIPARIVSCSRAGGAAHAALGYAAAKITVIPNGFDTHGFRPDPAARAVLRAEWGVDDDAPLLGTVARFDAAKDHRTLLRALAHARARVPALRLVLAGRGMTAGNPVLAEWLDESGVRDACILLGQRNDAARINAALDGACLSSVSEGFSNSIGEAMSCGVPCVVTDVGDSAWIVGSTGLVVPPRDPGALGEAMASLAEHSAPARRALGDAARARILRDFSLPAVVERYDALHEQLAASR